MIRRKLRLAVIAALFLLVIVPMNAPAQSRPNLMIVRLAYNNVKAQAKLEGELKDKIAALEKELAEAARTGRNGEARRLFSKGIFLLQGKEWTDELDFAGSLVLRAEEICVDSSRPFIVRLEQSYAPRIRLNASLTARVSLHRPEGAPLGIRTGEKIKDLAIQEGLSRDLLDDPGRIELNLAGIEDGTYLVRAEILEKEKSLGTPALLIDLRKGLSDRLGAIESRLKIAAGFDFLRADVLYPIDRIRSVNGGRIELGTFQIEAELKAAEAVLASIEAKRDPFAGRTGDMERHYLLEGANEIMPYRIYVPTKYDGKTSYPLIIALHGLGADQGSFFDGYGQRLPRLAEDHGYILAAPLGYRLDGFYGMNPFGMLGSPGDVSLNRKLEFSEKDVLNVLGLMRKAYKIDASRIYLLGHSMGAIGTWHLGAKYPEIWAALAPFSGYGLPATAAAMKNIPQIIVHGGADMTVPVAGSRAMAAELKKLGIEHRFIEVPGGNHINVVEPNLAAVVDFFDKHRKKTP
jgi:predicted esterase